MPSVNWSNVTTLAQLPGEANTASGGSFWMGMFYMMWIILMLLFIGYGFEVAIIVGSFIAMIIGLFLVYSDLMAWKHLLSIVGILLFMFLYVIWSTKKVRS